MKARTVVWTVALCLAAAAMVMASDANLGTWKLNEAKSKIPAGATKNTSVTYEAAGDNIKVTIEGTDGQGKAIHSEWTGKFDGKEYPVTGDPTADSRSYKTVDDHTLEVTSKKAGKATLNAKIVVAADGKSRTVTVNGTDSKGAKVTYSAVYDKQ